MRIAVTTCNSMRHLVPTFAKLLNKFWPENAPKVTVFGALPPDYWVREHPGNFTFMSHGEKDLPYADQLIWYLKELEDDHLILFHEDMFLLDYVDEDRLKEAVRFATQNNVDRFGLQTFKEGFDGQGSEGVGNRRYKVKENHQYLCSFEASIFRREFLLDVLVPGEDPHQTEINASQRAQGAQVYQPHDRILNYKDAVIHGEERIFIHNDELFLKVPKGEGEWKQTGVKV